MDTVGQGWTGVWSQSGHCLVISVGEGFAVGLVGWVTLSQVGSRSTQRHDTFIDSVIWDYQIVAFYYEIDK